MRLMEGLGNRWPSARSTGSHPRFLRTIGLMSRILATSPRSIGLRMWTTWMSSSEAARALHSLRPEKGRVSKVNQVSCSSTFDAFVRCVLDGSSGRTSRARSQASTGALSDSSCPKWTRSGMVWHGEYWMRSSSVWPSDASVCSLSEALEPCVPRKYYLSAKACRGIIRRAETRGKPLPENLRAALENQIAALEEGNTEPPTTEDV